MQMPSKSPSFPLLQRGTRNAKYLGHVSLQGRIHAPFSKPLPSSLFKANSIPLFQSQFHPPFFKANSIPPFSKGGRGDLPAHEGSLENKSGNQ
ncbi:MAG: hypothetical protein IE913_07180 [Halothiobacillus sp.]|nr:hypothetical protein [Halothiobacillus sp.]